MAEYEDSWDLRKARQIYFDNNGFGDGGYQDTWVTLKAGPIKLFFPNSAARVRAVRFHDLHHVLTGYDTTWLGEAEIGAWEVSTGCAHHWAAWILNLCAMAIGLILGPSKVLQAFRRGRQSRNLYREQFSESLLDKKLGQLRQDLALNTRIPDSGHGKGFFLWSLISIICLLTTITLSLSPWFALAGLFYWAFG